MTPEQNKSFRVIQQWDYFNKDWPELKNDDFMKFCADSGVTSLQSYVYWSSVEKNRGSELCFDFYDDIVGRMSKYGLKWTPFIIAGPDYATPDWFHNSNECVYAQCLEHGEDSRIQSVWNPYILKYVESFIRRTAEHFDHSCIESVLLGVTGNWGESIYPDGGGFNFRQRPFHTHLGWWGGDEFARKDFIRFCIEKYGDIDELNKRWGSHYCGCDGIMPPSRYELCAQKLASKIINMTSYHIDERLTNLLQLGYLKYLRSRHGGKFIQRICDFAQWYIESMYNYMAKWLSIARSCFPDNDIYVVTGGDGNPMLGVDFAGQARIAAKFGCGLRVSNQTDSSSENYALTRWAGTATRHYGGYFTTEEALYSSPDGIKMRLLDAISSGARGAYFKTILDCAPTDGCEMRVNGKGVGGNILRENLRIAEYNNHFTERALLLPTTTIRSIPFFINLIYKSAARLREHMDMDFICEEMIEGGYLSKYKELIVSHSSITRKETLERIEVWKRNGGTTIASNGVEMYGI